MIDVGGNIRKYRKAKGLTQYELAELIGKSEISVRKYESNDVTPSLSRMSIQRYEQGKTDPDISVIEAIANALDVTVPELLGYEIAECKSLSDYHTDELLRELWRRAK